MHCVRALNIDGKILYRFSTFGFGFPVQVDDYFQKKYIFISVDVFGMSADLPAPIFCYFFHLNGN